MFRWLSLKSGLTLYILLLVLPLAFHTCLIKRIEMGQFKKMKYIVGTKKKVAISVIVDNLSTILLSSDNVLYVIPSIIDPIKAVIAKVDNTIKNKFVGYFLISIPSLLKNLLLKTSTVLIRLKVIGIPNIVNKIIPIRKPGTNLIPIKHILNDHPIVMNNQNIRFHMLSLLQRFFIQLFIWVISTIYSFTLNFSLIEIVKNIISLYKNLCELLKLTLITIIINCIASLVYAQYEREIFYSQIITKVEQDNSIPTGLLRSIAVVESDIQPYVVNVEGKSYKKLSKQEAIDLIQSSIDKDITNIDIGIMQVNYRWHQSNFSNVSKMLEPEENIKYAAKLLSDLYRKYGNWQEAVRVYHSKNSLHHKKYSRKVIIAWLNN